MYAKPFFAPLQCSAGLRETRWPPSGRGSPQCRLTQCMPQCCYCFKGAPHVPTCAVPPMQSCPATSHHTPPTPRPQQRSIAPAAIGPHSVCSVASHCVFSSQPHMVHGDLLFGPLPLPTAAVTMHPSWLGASGWGSGSPFSRRPYWSSSPPHQGLRACTLRSRAPAGQWGSNAMQE